MSDPLTLSLGQQFELERMSRAIDATVDPEVLQKLAKQLLQAWHSQKAATQWVMRQQLDAPARIPGHLGLNDGAQSSKTEALDPDAPGDGC